MRTRKGRASLHGSRSVPGKGSRPYSTAPSCFDRTPSRAEGAHRGSPAGEQADAESTGEVRAEAQHQTRRAGRERLALAERGRSMTLAWSLPSYIGNKTGRCFLRSSLLE